MRPSFYSTPSKPPADPQPDMSHCCDNRTLRLILRVIFSGAPTTGGPNDHIILPHLPNELIPIIADFTTGCIGQLFQRVWNTPQIQHVWSLRAQYQLTDSTRYFFDRIMDTTVRDYIPSVEDVLRARHRTIGVLANEFTAYGHHLKIYDVGGQRGEVCARRNGSAVQLIRRISRLSV